ncbi:Protein of uncharacterised function (DUF503) [Mycobacterium tuberculosis]|nr:Protein of uncharacterised function (DUF503) [Mycobacterium tuberculosis]CMS99111.1 Protein of uncharacterised function (DUF503) [Mycobacterium tuberculosis]
MWIGWLEFDVLLGDVRSLKQKRSVTRPLVAELQRKFSVSAAETVRMICTGGRASVWPWCPVTAATPSMSSTTPNVW